MLSEADFQEITERGFDKKEVEEQIENFINGFPYLNIIKPATIESGIKKPEQDEIDRYINLYDKERDNLKIVKFVPASGAASRMFKELFNFMESYTGSEEEYLQLISDRCFTSNYYLYERMESFAFFEDLKNEINKGETGYEEIVRSKDYVAILKTLLNEDGLNYGKLPKGLIKFHKYEDHTRTPVEEHIIEGIDYSSSKNQIELHFTVSEQHLKLFKKHLNEVIPNYEKKFNVKINYNLSVQNPKTDIIAVNVRNNPIKDKNGKLVFRPGGHGALLENLNSIDADIVFIKNIDNVVPDRLKEDTIKYKKMLAGVLFEINEKIKLYTRYLELSKKPSSRYLKAIAKFLENELCILPPKSMYRYSRKEKTAYFLSKLKRPLRVCGMVKNEGEPGGGPFWAENKDGSISLQIVEGSQFDKKKKKQMQIFNDATHFNPVDIVCTLIDYTGKKFDLKQFRDSTSGIISRKSKDGVTLKAQELPGLWNGSMSDWNTVFVEVPITTFNPVKVINDLLRNEHCAIESVVPDNVNEV